MSLSPLISYIEGYTLLPAQSQVPLGKTTSDVAFFKTKTERNSLKSSDHFILFSCLFLLLSLSRLQLHAIRLSAGGDPVTRSVGLEIKGRTRRFVMDESTELKENISRAEIQVRLFKREKEKVSRCFHDKSKVTIVN